MVQQVTVSAQQTCGNPKNLGWCSVLLGLWDPVTSKVTHPKANPLECVYDEDINNFRVRFIGLPPGFVVTASPQGSSYTSTATIAWNEVTFTLPAAVGILESWTVGVGPVGAPAVDDLTVKLKRTMPP